MSKAKTTTKEKEDWMQKKWRPMMAIMYMVVCVFDFIIFPIMFTIVQFWETQAANDAFRQWQPITLVGAGLFHMAMGAVLGITAWSRGQEKMAGVAANNPATSGFNTQPTGYTPTGYTPTNYMPPQNGNFGQSYSGFESTQETISVAPVTSYKGKKAPPEPNYPVI